MKTIIACLLGLSSLIVAENVRNSDILSSPVTINNSQQSLPIRTKNKKDEPKEDHSLLGDRNQEKTDLWKIENTKRDPTRDVENKRKKKYYYKAYKENRSILRPDEISKLFENPSNHNYIKDYLPTSRISANAEYIDSRMEVNCERCRLCMEEHQRKIRSVLKRTIMEEQYSRRKREVDTGHGRLKKRKRKIRRRLPKKTAKKLAVQNKKLESEVANKTGFSITSNDSHSVTYITKLNIPPLKSELLQVNETEHNDNETVIKCHIYQITKLMTCDSPEGSAISSLIKKAEGNETSTGVINDMAPLINIAQRATGEESDTTDQTTLTNDMSLVVDNSNIVAVAVPASAVTQTQFVSPEIPHEEALALGATGNYNITDLTPSSTVLTRETTTHDTTSNPQPTTPNSS